MFGIKKKRQQANDQIPYQVYETVHRPTARRRRWIIRLVAALAIVTLLIMGGLALRDKSRNSKPSQIANPSGTSQTKSGQPNTDLPSQQPPQTNAPLPKPNTQPVTTPESDATNTATVRQPE